MIVLFSTSAAKSTDMNYRQYFIALCLLAPLSFLRAQWTPRQILHPVNRETVKAIPADLNNDGKKDVFLLSASPNRISWQMSLIEPGAYGLVLILPTTAAVNDAITGDYDLDGDPDIIASVDYPSRLVWYENTGAPGQDRFAPEAPILQGEIMEALQLTDLNNDGWPDLIFTGFLNEVPPDFAFHIMMGTGPGTYSPALSARFRVPIGLSETPPYFFFRPDHSQPIVHIYGRFRPDGGSMESARITFNFDNLSFDGFTPIDEVNFQIRDVADIDQDGAPELLGSGFQEVIFYYTYINDTWERRTVYGSPLANSWGSKFHDVDADGLTDIVFGLDTLTNPPFYQPERLSWVRQTAPLEFGAIQPLTAGVQSNAVFDFQYIDADTLPDLLFYYEDELRPGYQSRLADGSWSRNQYFPAGLVPHHFVAGDADEDGDTDLFASDIIANTIFSFRQASGALRSIHIERANLPLPAYISGGDFDQDGRFELLVSEARPLPDGRVYWMEQQGNEWTEQVIDEEQYALPFLFPRDMDEDGDLDIVASSGVHAVIYYPNLGDGSFGERTTVGTTASYRFATLADWDGDGKEDLIARPIGPFDQVTLHRWNGEGFDEAIPLTPTGTGAPEQPAPFDIDGDGMPELVASFTSEIRFWEHEPPGALNNILLMDLPFGTDTGRFFANDLNGDEKQDLFFLTLNTDQTTTLHWLNGPSNLNGLDFQSIMLDSMGYASVAHQTPIFSTVPDLITLHEQDQTLRIFANGMGPVATREAPNSRRTVRVFPNPANDYFELQAEGMTVGQVDIFNAQGQRVYTQALESRPLVIHTAGWATGLYLVGVSNGYGIAKTVKVMVSR
jgi:hypothetical protein